MARLQAALGTSLFLGVLGALVFAGCGSDGDDSTFGGNGSSGSSGTSGSSGFLPGDNDGGSSGGPCVGLQCNQTSCPSGGTTTLTGKVYDPTGTVPLYNAVVYVPNAELTPFTEGVTCDKCGTAPSGNPVATAITNAKGEFTLENVPVDVDVPLVVQIGRWRRKVTIPAGNVTKCGTAPIDAGLTRLPRNKAEGEIPKIAITTGGADSLECFLRKLGIDDAEITAPTGDGRIHLYQGRNDEDGQKDGSQITGSQSDGNALWDDLATLKKYDMVILSCEGSENNSTKNGAKENLRQYLDAGGRVFASHFHYTWFKNPSDNPLRTTANWISGGDISSADMTVDTSFAKGQAFKDWLVEAGASPTTPGLVPAKDLRTNVASVPANGAPAETSRRWLSVGDNTKFYSFNAPLGVGADQQCGRGVYTDIHVSSGKDADGSGGTFPGNCKSPKPALSPQEKALLFLLMDLASCIQDDNQPPAPPPIVK